MRIRRGLRGMAYTVENPKTNLIWVNFLALTDGQLEGHFAVPYAGRFEVMFGNEGGGQDVEVFLDGRHIEKTSDETYGTDLGSLEPGRSYLIRVQAKPGRTLNSQESLVVYPWRNWKFEQELLGDNGDTFTVVSIMRTTGIPSALISVEELMAIMNESDPTKLRAELNQYKIRFILLDKTLKTIFPAADKHLSESLLFTKGEYDEGTLFELRP